MKAILFIALAALLVFSAADAGRLAKLNPSNNAIAADTVIADDSLIVEMVAPRVRVNVSTFFIACDTFNVGTNDSIRVMGRNVSEPGDTTYAGIWLPILWLSGGDTYATSEWLVFTPGVLYESAVASDSTFVPGAGHSIELYFETASTDTIPIVKFDWDNKE